MAFSVVVSGNYKQRGRPTQAVARGLTIDSRITDRQQAYENAIFRLIENNELGLESGTYNFKNMRIIITG